VVLVQVVGARRGGQIPVLTEALLPGVKLVFSLSGTTGARHGGGLYFQQDEDLLLAADAFYRRVWDKTEKAAPPVEGSLLRLGQGSGAWSTSMLLLAEDLGLTGQYQVTPPATRQLVDSRDSLGWVVLSPASDHPVTKKATPPEAVASARLEPSPRSPAPAGPSGKLRELLARLEATRPHDGGRLGMFFDGLQGLAGSETKVLARRMLGHFDRQMLKKHKRWEELSQYLEK
jgi:hypothetical protein